MATPIRGGTSSIQENGITYNAVFTDKTDNSTMTATDFLNLIITELTNQDFTNTTDTTDMVNQLSQFSMVNAMEELSSYSKSSYAMSLLGKTVSATRYTTTGTETITDTCDKVSLVDGEYVVFIGGKQFNLSQIMQVEPEKSSSSATTDKDSKTDGTGSTGSTDSTGSTTGSNSTTGNTSSQVKPMNFAISSTNITSSTADIAWEVPTEDETAAKGLTYTVYYAPYDSKNAFDTVDAVSAGTMAGEAERSGTTAALTDLEPNTQYSVNVVVTDSNGVKSVYQPIHFKTETA